MAESEKDRIARQTADARVNFDMTLSDDREYPVAKFKAFVQKVRRYIEITAGDPMIHRSVVQAVVGLREFLEVKTKRIPQIFCLKRTGWSASSSRATIQLLRG